MKALLTGANGFIGKRLTRRLLRAGFSLRLLTRDIGKFKYKSSNVDIVEGDLSLNKLDLHSLVSGCDLIFHCAAEISDISKMRSLHIDATKRLLKAAVEIAKIEGKKIHWIQLSSIGVYGNFSKQVNITEKSRIAPKSDYEKSKAVSDKILIQMLTKSNVTYSILRPSNVVGNDMKNKSFFSLINAIKSRKFFFVRNRESIANYIHVDDVVEALFLCGTSFKAKNQIFNLSNDCKLAEIVYAVCITNNISKKIYCLPEFSVRLLCSVMTIFNIKVLTINRINALTSLKTYPSNKIKNYLGFLPLKPIPRYASQYAKNNE
ncbi:NAD-dependent epimerase/dehydratase family protein [Candidatus Methylopumilus rimovensis]|uniref:NAD-dependent epimerase/dehydratase family protein n=1 Tax=Candidatus Methylopumilus rimovensis TaxID=2588535 RepID=A0AAE6KP29_9PROT|nr:NAD-dependent epimerase/dehydratase family protein [Candidatus Methylopumilus rimovensis]QDD13381.1 NAD-dependent epimerase/dehydratase family protein [Candidatus Methylopumilus rimovensis]